MSNPYYNNTGYPQFRAPGKSEDMRAELKRIEGGLDRLPDPIMPNQPVFGNASGTGMVMKDKRAAKALLGLDKVDNTADAGKPISDAVANALATKADKAKTEAAISSISRSMVPVGTIVPYMGGYFANGANGDFVSVWGNDAAALNARFNAAGWYVCNGAMLKLPGSPFFDGVNRYLPNLTDDRFIMGAVRAGLIGGNNAMAHTHTIAHTHTMAHTHTIAHVHATSNHTLTASQIPSHNHAHEGWAHADGTTYGHSTGGSHAFANISWAGSYIGGSGAHNHGNTGGSNKTNSGGASNGTTSAASNADTGAASYVENRPKFVSCFFLMRVI